MKFIKYQSVFKLPETSTERDPKVVASTCSWKLQVVCSWGHSFTLAVRCLLRLGAGMRCWPDTADRWQGRAATPQGHFQRSPVQASVPATVKQDASPMGHLDCKCSAFMQRHCQCRQYLECHPLLPTLNIYSWGFAYDGTGKSDG